MPSSRLSKLIVCSTLFWVAAGVALAQELETLGKVLEDPVVQGFIGPGGFGAQHPDAPPQTSEFGQLVGVWHADQEILTRDHGWVPQPGAIWVWKYILGGYATQDLWYQQKDNLPAYLGMSGRHYLLTGLRVFDPSTNKWKIGWASNAAGETPGSTAGSFDGQMVNGELVMSGPPVTSEQGTLSQRVVFSDFSPDHFEWRSEFSRDDGHTWIATMKIHARRLR